MCWLISSNYWDTYHPLNTMQSLYNALSYDVASGSEITLCIKIDKPLAVYRFTGIVMTSVTMLHT